MAKEPLVQELSEIQEIVTTMKEGLDKIEGVLIDIADRTITD